MTKGRLVFTLAAWSFCMLVVCLGHARAQTVSGTLAGRVVDATGASVAGVSITATGMDTGLERKTVSSSDGFYQLTFVPLGRYRITVESTGFRPVRKEEVEVRLNETTVVDFKLEPGAIKEEIIVSASDVPTINTVNGEIKTSFDSQVVTDKPLAGRNFLNLAEIVPGFQNNLFSGQNNPTLSTGSSINFNGTGSRGATFQTDGVNNDDSSENQNRQGVNISTIKTFQILTNSYTSEFGRGYGAVVLVQTKNGTNDFHGEAYWFHQNSVFNANNFFRNAAGRIGDRGDAPGPGQRVGQPRAPVPPSRRHQFGFTSGGPIRKNKFFYFASLDKIKNGGSQGFTEDVLFPNERAADPSVTNPADRAFIQSVIDRFPKVTPNNLAAGPRAFTTTRLFDFPAEDYTGRVDWRATDHDNITFRYQYSHQLFTAEDIIIGERADQNNRQQNFGIAATHVFSPTTVGEFRFAVGRRRTLVDIQAGNDTPVIRFSGTLNASIIGNAGAFPIHRFQTDFQYVFNLSTVKWAKHGLKFGTDIRRQQLNDLADNFSRGFYTFAAAGGLDAYGNFLRGITSSYQKGYGPFALGNRNFEMNFYAQDEFKASRGLSLNLGVRYESVKAPSEVNNLTQYGFNDDRNNVEPRFGFAWSPMKESGWVSKLTGGPGKFVVRGGYGIYHGRVFQSIFSQSGATLRFNPPNAAFLVFSNPTRISDPTGGFVFVPGPPTARIAFTQVDPGFHLPYTQQWNLTLERQLPWSLALSLGYNGNRGIGLPFYDFGNRPDFPACAPNHPFVAGQFRGVCFDKIDANPLNTNPAPGFISLSQMRINERRPDPRYSTLVTITNAAWSYYHGMQLKVDKRFSNGLSFQSAYTWSKAMDTGSEPTFSGVDVNAAISKVNAAKSLRAVSAFDTRHRFTFNYSYRLPFFRTRSGILGQALGGWQISGTTSVVSGLPWTAFIGYDYNADSIGGDRPNLLDPRVLGRSVDNPRPDPSTGLQIGQTVVPGSAFDPNATTATTNRPFAPGLANKGNLGRNTFRVHGVKNWDFGLFKNFRVTERVTLAFRSEFYNLFNRAQFAAPSQTVTLSTFGRISGQFNSPRFLQFAFRLIY